MGLLYGNSSWRLQCLIASRIDLGAKVGGGCASSREVAREDWLNEGSEHNLSAASDRKSKPEDKKKLEGVVEWEPVDCIHSAFKNGEECEHYPVSEPLSVIRLPNTEECVKGIVSRYHKSSNIGEELTGNVEEDEEEVECAQAEESVNLGNRGLLFQIVQNRVLRKLLINLGDVALSFVLERHGGARGVLLRQKGGWRSVSVVIVIDGWA